jgi:hypothetical protein
MIGLSKKLFFTLITFLGLILSQWIQASPHFGIVVYGKWAGEREAAQRIKIAADRLGWKAFLDETGGSASKNKVFDWIIHTVPNVQYFNQKCANYLTVFDPVHFLNPSRQLLKQYEKYDGYLLTIKDRNSLLNRKSVPKKHFYYIPFYPTTYATPYQELTFNELVVMIPAWGNRRTDPKFLSLYQALSTTKLAKFYGFNPMKEINPKTYMGPLPFDGASVINVLQQHGIVLVMHSDIHNEEGIPSARIFEAAAASAIIISDLNSFVKQHFNDSVFYIDTTQSAETIFQQIQEHLQVIYNQPELAHKMAQQAHQIFSTQFTMEQQLLNLQQMHINILNDTKLENNN